MAQPDGTAARFPETRWSIVQRARGDTPEVETRRALEDICRGYWLPLYAFVRRSGERPAEAEELTQEFLLRLVEGDYLARADRERGKLRTFLLACLKHFLADQQRLAYRQKRGGGQVPVSIDQLLAENTYGVEPVDELTPDAVYERRWAMSLMNQVLDGLALQMMQEGKQAQFDALAPFLRLGAPQSAMSEVAATLGMSEDAVKMGVSRLRQRYRERLREAVRDTLGPDDDLETEMQHLRSVLAAST